MLTNNTSISWITLVTRRERPQKDVPPTVPMMSLKPQDSVNTGGVGSPSAAPAAGFGTHGRKKGSLDPI